MRRFFDTAPRGAVATHETADGDHGRIEVRRACVSHDVAWFASDRRFPDEWRFPDLTMIGMVEAEVERDGKTTRARRYCLSSATLSAQAFATAVRAHWDIENRLHRALNVVFHDDLMRLRTGSGLGNMVTIRRAAPNIVKKIPNKGQPQGPPQTLGWDAAISLPLSPEPHHEPSSDSPVPASPGSFRTTLCQPANRMWPTARLSTARNGGLRAFPRTFPSAPWSFRAP